MSGEDIPAGALYDEIGAAYGGQRRTDPRIAARIRSALGDARTVLNVGAGTGSYEPPDRLVTAVEPSAVMRAARPVGAPRCIAASAESLPFADGSFDAAIAVLSDHHWRDPIAGLLEMRRVARRVIVFQWDNTRVGLRIRRGARSSNAWLADRHPWVSSRASCRSAGLLSPST